MNSDELNQFIEKKFSMPKNEGQNKLADLSESIREHIKPGMSLYFGFFHSRAYAIAYEIARQFWGQSPNFELVAAGVLEYGVILLQGGMVKKIIAAFGGNTYPYPSPNKVVQQKFKDGEVQFENWTNLTIPLRLMCGALNLPFMTTNSLLGSNIAEENQHSFQLIKNPFARGKKSGVMQPLNPDIALIHGFAADRNGNTIILGPYGEDAWGVMACEHGALVTVEHLVSTEFIRQHSHLVRIPGHMVKSVTVVPFGAHPQPMTNLGLEQFTSYGEDYEFRLDFKASTNSIEKIESWIKEWVLDCPSHKDYLSKLGHKRIFFLMGKSWTESWRYELMEKLDELTENKEFTSNEAMIICAARGIKKTIVKKKYKVVLAGAGLASLAAWVAVYDLKRQGFDVELMAESGFFGFLPRPADPYVFNYCNIPTNKMQTGFIEILGVIGGGRKNQCLAVIGAGQVDKLGNVNTTKISDNYFVVGSGGANDIGSTASEVALLCQQGRDKFVDKVEYITTPGSNVSQLYSGKGVYHKIDPQKEFILTGLIPTSASSSKKRHIENIKETCGWDIQIAESIDFIENPTDEELLTLRLFDPDRLLISQNSFRGNK
jgi:acyl CoA:acetate/3-ketoacid CoA transferase alpha subunit/acyl CoA:acetate/3-ketoacid CoA transferase beta subunit